MKTVFSSIESFKQHNHKDYNKVRILNKNWEYHIIKKGKLFEGKLVYRKHCRDEMVYNLSKNRSYTANLLENYPSSECVDILYHENITGLLERLINLSNNLESYYELES